MTEKYLTVPRLSMVLEKNTRTWIHIKVEKVRNLKREKQDCIHSPDYSFTTCVEDFIQSEVGCRHPYHQFPETSKSLSNCSDVEVRYSNDNKF